MYVRLGGRILGEGDLKAGVIGLVTPFTMPTLLIGSRLTAGDFACQTRL